MRARASEVGRFQTLLQEIQSEPTMTLSGLSVAVREISLLSDRLNGGAPPTSWYRRDAGIPPRPCGRRGR